ncbi:hypothetical protein FHR92_000677 [Fontibacillus solani]|uniref:Uncharacterized protein n=1 Tax=Fontibacillus solani TaxID=1572857 RepID=A0A7W3SQA0_9BACL|nr:hypothetical protein [Fontibacillus solani]
MTLRIRCNGADHYEAAPDPGWLFLLYLGIGTLLNQGLPPIT